MYRQADTETNPAWADSFPSPGAAESHSQVAAELASYLPHLGKMSIQLKQTSAQIEESVVGVCLSFQGIADRARATVQRTSSFLGENGTSAKGKRSFDDLIQSCGNTMVRIMNTTAEAGDISRRAIDQIEQMDTASRQISIALARLEVIANENKMLALNARIEAAHSGSWGAGFEVVAMEVARQTQRSLQVTDQVSTLVDSLRTLAESTLQDLRQINQRDQERIEQCRLEVDRSLDELKGAHGEMKTMLTGMTEQGALLANDIGSAVRGLQFQDRVSQRIAHVVEDLDTLQSRLTDRFGNEPISEAPDMAGFSAYTMREEREIGGPKQDESDAGDIELF